MRRRAFTLIELLTVIAISSILLSIIAIPLIQSFNLTRVGQGFAEAQSRARILIDAIAREISTSSGVRDNTGDKGAVDIWLPGKDGKEVFVRLYNAKVDILMPMLGEPVRGNNNDPNAALLNPNILIDPNGDPTDPNNWKQDPTLRTPNGQVSLPATTGFRLVRYFIGLRNPFAKNSDARAQYANPFNNMLAHANVNPENLYVVYRAEVDYRTWDAANARWVFNAELFPGNAAFSERSPLDDPAFFVPDGTAAKAATIRAWLRHSRIVTELSRYDAIEPVFNKSTFRAEYDGNVPRIVPLIQFRPTRVANEPPEGQVAVRSNEEFEGSAKMGSEIFLTKYGGWTNETVRCYPSTYNSAAPWLAWTPWHAPSLYQIARPWTLNNGEEHVSIFSIVGQVANRGMIQRQDLSGGTEVFDVTAYSEASRAEPGVGINHAGMSDADRKMSRFPFSFAVDQADQRSNWLGDAAAAASFVPFATFPRMGKVLAGFGVTEMGTDGLDRQPNAPATWKNKDVFAQGRDNRPYTVITGTLDRTTGATIPLIPAQDIVPTVANEWTKDDFSPSNPKSDINRRFNILWNSWDLQFPGPSKLSRQANCKRFLDLRFVPLADGTPSPLDPARGWKRARIVPGSEVVIGPDQIKPYVDNRVNYVRYQRVAPNANGNVIIGPNEYAINYVDRPQAAQEAFEELGLAYPAPDTYDANSFASAIIAARFEAGYIEFHSDPDTPLPSGNLSINYRFQFTEAQDSFSVDYDSREIIDINVTVKNYPSSTTPNAQSVTLRGSATSRNFVR
jgi:prepilin-type N-terminal cleavage/methylation domain-containing protein